jgi:hypothetical protein
MQKMEEKKMNAKNRKRSEKIEPNGFPKPGPVHPVCTGSDRFFWFFERFS